LYQDANCTANITREFKTHIKNKYNSINSIASQARTHKAVVFDVTIEFNAANMLSRGQKQVPVYPNNHQSLQRHRNMVKPSMDELDKKLEELALTAQKSPVKSLSRQIALTKLMQSIQESGSFGCRKYNYSDDIYNEALQETWLYICRKIENYKPEVGKVLAWVNFILDKRFKDAIKRKTKNSFKSLDEPIYMGGDSEATHLTLLDTIEQQQTESDDAKMLKEILSEDLQGVFSQEHIKHHPEANFKEIVLRRLAQQSWKEMSIEWGIAIPTLSSFYRRCIQDTKILHLLCEIR
jgi:DNA-directed RNA polymerase specialized sigma24 family protein